MAIVDGNGCLEIIGICILPHENEESFFWLIRKLQDLNPVACSKIKSCMTDKDMVARKQIKELLEVPAYICSFHVQPIFHRIISISNMEINKEEIKKSKKFLQILLYARSENVYMEIYKEFCKEVPKTVLDYYNDNWHNIRHEWVRGHFTDSNFKKATNNRVESLNQKLKLFLPRCNYLTDFFKDYFGFLRIHNNEHNQKAKDVFAKHPMFLLSDDETSYSELLTKYAFDYVLEEVRQMENVNYVCKLIDNTHSVNFDSFDRNG